MVGRGIRAGFASERIWAWAKCGQVGDWRGCGSGGESAWAKCRVGMCAKREVKTMWAECGREHFVGFAL